MAATAAATSQNKPANSNCTCCGSRLRPAMFEDLLVDIIGEKSSAPPNIAASNPVCIAESDVPAALIEKEREIFLAQAATSGKPADIVEKMIGGQIRKFIGGITLLGQPFVKDPDTTVGKLLGKDGVVRSFIRYEVGEGIEKKEVNFAEEVAAQARGA